MLKSRCRWDRSLKNVGGDVVNVPTDKLLCPLGIVYRPAVDLYSLLVAESDVLGGECLVVDIQIEAVSQKPVYKILGKHRNEELSRRAGIKSLQSDQIIIIERDEDGAVKITEGVDGVADLRDVLGGKLVLQLEKLCEGRCAPSCRQCR